MNNISKVMKDMMKIKQITYNELEKTSGIPRSTLQRYVSGTAKRVPINNAQRIAAALGVTTEYLIGWTDDEKANYQRDKTIDKIMAIVKSFGDEEREAILAYVEYIASKSANKE